MKQTFRVQSARVAALFNRIAERRPLPPAIKSDNGEEFTRELMLKWSVEHKIYLHFIEFEKPNQNASVESFNGRCVTSFSTSSFSNDLPRSIGDRNLAH
ncbi:MAG: DDE-type integrase/transposase/recombinase [Candidatus Eremiobacteraeota bacterium]|nr:DDE-type integrase/transposase/recombinase [Candidatus Eremiobacteraeota bacterium]